MLYCWGDNGSGQVGNGTTNDVSVPTRIGTATNWSGVSLGDTTSCARRDGELWCWGGGSNGALGIGTTTNATSPTRVGLNSDWLGGSGGGGNGGVAFNCGLRGSGELWCWGGNSNGQLGLGHTFSPAPVVFP
ncbi:MAG TPA: hypothetical protein PK095_02390 [Myxococcota bacterium]|nr:hypothetical protein [Myxococcota bacterium]